MNIPGHGEFTVVGENIHTTRVLLRKGKLVVDRPDGSVAVRFYDAEGKRRYLTIPERIQKTQTYEGGQVKHVIVAVQGAMAGSEDGIAYLHRMIQRQEEAGSDYLDLNVDEISLKPEEQREAMTWLVGEVGAHASTALSIDSSNVETIAAGLVACSETNGRPMLNSVSLERLNALDLAVDHNARVIITAAGESGMPSSAEERVGNASRVVDAAEAKGIEQDDLFIDPLVFPISVDSGYGIHFFDAVRTLRSRYPDIHITGGFSNVSFGIPSRRIVNDVFTILAVEAGADSGIIDPTSGHPSETLDLDRTSHGFQLAEAMLMGKDEYCSNFIKAWRNKELD
jgi:5-methyltetrahydrofolate--homocysteine methyltransferase